MWCGQFTHDSVTKLAIEPKGCGRGTQTSLEALSLNKKSPKRDRHDKPGVRTQRDNEKRRTAGRGCRNHVLHILLTFAAVPPEEIRDSALALDSYT